MGWKIIKIDDDCILKTYLENLQIIQSDRKLLIPISDIDTLLIDNNRIRLTINLINKLSEKNVNVIICDSKHLPQSLILPVNGNVKTYEVFKKQLSWDEAFKNKCWNWIMKLKCYNQLFLIRNKYDISDWMKKILTEEINFKTKNIESQIANLFFHQAFGNDFNRKNNNDLINHLFNYCYTILTSMVCRSIISKGLNQHIAFFHGSGISTFPLAFDIVEIFRVIADFYVIQLNDYQILKNNEFITREMKDGFLEYISNLKILVDDKRQFLNNTIDLVIDWIIKDELDLHKIDIVNMLVDSTGE